MSAPNVVQLHPNNPATTMSPEARNAMAACCIRIRDALDYSITDTPDRLGSIEAHDKAAEVLGWAPYSPKLSERMQRALGAGMAST